MSLIFGLNAIFYKDDDIRARAHLDSNPNSSYWVKLMQTIPKSLTAMVTIMAFNFLIGYIITIPSKIKEKIIRALRTRNKILIPYMQ